MAGDVVQGLRKITSAGSLPNAMDFLIDAAINGKINTAIPVMVMSVQAGGASGAAGYADVKPLICQSDAEGNALQPVTIFHLPYFRLQAGTAAVVLDPVAGDVGLAVFAQSDCSTLGQGAKQPVQAGSWRKFDQADGFYIGGFLNNNPSVFIELRQDGVINMTAAASINMTTPRLNVTGKISAGGDISAGSISSQNHTHGGVQSGSSSTGVPNS